VKFSTPKAASTVLPFVLLCSVVVVSGVASAKTTAPRTFCELRPDAPDCQGRVPTCAMCHAGPPTFNAYGADLVTALYATDYDGSNFDAMLDEALNAIGADDADGDGLLNDEELTLGLAPGNPLSHWAAPAAPEGERNAFYDVGTYDADYAMQRVALTFCGSRATYEQREAFSGESDKGAALDALLDECLTSDYWRNDALPRMADKRIKPLEAIGFDGLIPLADYNWDYRLFVYALTDGHDARDLLLADYHVDVEGNIIEGIIPIPPNAALPVGGQPLPPERRAGMITTQWFLMSQTMFSHLPRTTAAQAYRSYLGADIARLEGILPVEGEPVDVDNAEVAQEACARCHSTLDPLAYAFTPYDGIGGGYNNYGGGNVLNALHLTGAYTPERDIWNRQSVFAGSDVQDLVDWADVAANSDMFRRNLVMMFWEQAFQRPPLPDELDTFHDLFNAVPGDNYSVDALLHRLIHTDAFGVP